MEKKIHSCNKEAEISQILTEIKLIKEKQDEMYKRLFERDGLISEHEQVKGALRLTQVMGTIAAFLITLYITLKDKFRGLI
jgi:hypothetical protein